MRYTFLSILMLPIAGELAHTQELSRVSGGTVAQEAAQRRAIDEAAIKDAFLKRQSTFNDRDLRGQLSLFADDLVFNRGNGRIYVSGKEDYGLVLLVVWKGWGPVGARDPAAF